MKTAIKAVTGIMSLFLTLPIWFYIIHSLLAAAHADRLLWFLFWVYVPLTFLVSGLNIIADKLVDKG